MEMIEESMGRSSRRRVFVIVGPSDCRDRANEVSRWNRVWMAKTRYTNRAFKELVRDSEALKKSS